MEVAPADPVAAAETARRRMPGPDVVRAVALIGVALMNYHGYLILRGGARDRDSLFDPWVGPLATRFAATFVLTAGVGVTLLTRRAADDPGAAAARRWTLVRRGLVLYGFGLVFDMIWPGTILPFYGAMFVVAALLWSRPTAVVVAVGAGAAVAGAGIAWWRVERALDGDATTWLTRSAPASPRGLLFDVFVNGTHPLLPWLAFFCAGIVLGRRLRDPSWRFATAGTGLVLFGAATLVPAVAGSGPRAVVLASTDPWDRGLPYTASALGTALVAFAGISWLAERSPSAPAVDVLRHAGAMTLTLYVAHALVFNAVVDWFGWVEPGGFDTALALAALFWAAAMAAGWWWHRRFGIGPAERLYRKLGA